MRPAGGWLERLALKLVLFALGTLVVMQALAGPRGAGTFLSYAERLEGPLPQAAWAESPQAPNPAAGPAPPQPVPDTPSPVPSGAAQGAWITLLLCSRPSDPSARLLINGRPAGSFLQPLLTVAVRHGDRLEVDVPEGGGTLTIRVVGAAPDLLWPRLGQEFDCRGLGLLGEIRRLPD
ncbi:MAG: hypothetical protein K6T75_04975 [Acetobacteraceae bacterium]|nr:hypothetical protein [Acetobacteraceae bacterium]